MAVRDGRIGRRALLGLLGSGALAPAARSATQAARTPPQAAGPFYPAAEDRPADTDWDLVRLEGAVREAGGAVLHLTGRVLDRQEAPVAGAPVEIWQCDVTGRYHHPRDRAPAGRDRGFQGFGRAVTDARGRYRFRTLRPVPYPGRTPHIHARIGRPDGSWLTTQIYVAGEPLNARDILFRRLGRRAQAAASLRLARVGNGDWAAEFDIRL